MPRFDHGLENRLDSVMAERRSKDIIDKAYQKALAEIAENRAIEPRAFTKFNYDPAIIEEDLRYVEVMEKKFKQDERPEFAEQQKLATILVVIMQTQIEMNDWMGPDVTTKQASRYDDIKNGIDTICEFEQESGVQHLALALDITSSWNPTKKLSRIKEEIDAGKLSTVKYFESSDETFHGTLQLVPRVVIGAERKAIVELAELWLNKKNKELASHPIQLQILNEIVHQLKAFMNYAEKKGKTNVAAIYNRSLRLMDHIRSSSDKIALASKHKSVDYATNDTVYANIIDGLSIFR